MEDVSEVFDHYRMSARSVWNAAFWPDRDFRDWNSAERFQEIERILFDQLVLFKQESAIRAYAKANSVR